MRFGCQKFYLPWEFKLGEQQGGKAGAGGHPCLQLTLDCPCPQSPPGIRPGQALGAGPLPAQRPLPPRTPRIGQPRGPRTASAGTSAGSSTKALGLWTRAACPSPPDPASTAPGTGTGRCSSRFIARCQTCSWTGPPRSHPKTPDIQGPSKDPAPGPAQWGLRAGKSGTTLENYREAPSPAVLECPPLDPNPQIRCRYPDAGRKTASGQKTRGTSFCMK